MEQTLIQAINSALSALQTCQKSENVEWIERWEERIADLEEKLPHGSGFDGEMRVNIETSTPGTKVVIMFDYHHMNSDGYYVGWSHSEAHITPRFDGFDVEVDIIEEHDICGGQRLGVDDWLDYVMDVFQNCLSEKVSDMDIVD